MVNISKKLINQALYKFFQSSQLLMCIANPDGFIVEMNEKMKELLEKSPQISANPELSELICGERPNKINSLKNILEGKCETLKLKTVFRTTSSKKYRLEWIFTYDQETTLIFGVASDVTQKEEHELRERQRAKMEAIGQLAGGIAHDFNNQIAGILGYADFIKENCTEKKNQLYADRIIKCAKNAADLTQKVLAYSRKANFENIKVDVNELVDEAVAILERTIDKKIKLSVKKRSLYPVTRGDPTMLQNALLNLCINARDAMPHGGELIIETKNTRINDEFVENHQYEMKQGEYIRISITDNGMGISKPDLEKIFEPFFTTKIDGKGTGMGLAAVYGTVKGHKGGINVYSEPGLGSTFNLYLPVYRERKVTANLTEKIKIKELKANVLLIDDDDSVRDVLSDMLQYFGCSVFQCNNGQEGVSFYQNNHKNIDLVVMDLVMPKMNGREAFLEMKKINSEIKSLLISGYSLNRNLEITLSEGASGFIQKPFSKENFFRKIVEIID